MKRVRIPIKSMSICAALILALGVGWHWYRWGDFSKKPLFMNRYSSNRGGLGPWRWQFDGPLIDSFGRLLLIDSKSNMIAVVVLPRPTSRVLEHLVFSQTKIDFRCEGAFFNISEDSGAAIAVDGDRTIMRTSIAPGVAQRLYDEITDDPSKIDGLIGHFMNMTSQPDQR